MPPRFVYWTILIDNKPTAFRAQDKDDLLPTLTQLRRTNKDVAMKYFAHGRVWDSPEQAREHSRKPASTEKRGRDWRPGGSHEDPRARFDGKKAKSGAGKPRGDQRPWQGDMPGGAGRPGRPAEQRPERRPPWTPKPKNERRPWQSTTSGTSTPGEAGRPRGNSANRRPWSPKPNDQRRPWQGKPGGAGRPGGPAEQRRERRPPWTPKPKDERRPWQSTTPGTSTPGEAGRPRGNGANRRPWNPKPNDQRRPWQAKPGAAGRPGGPGEKPRPWQRDQPEEKKPKTPEDEGK
jgi:hypothetical protein